MFAGLKRLKDKMPNHELLGSCIEPKDGKPYYKWVNVAQIWGEC